jgi:hypothetical protein
MICKSNGHEKPLPSNMESGMRFKTGLNMGHPKRKLILNCVRRTLQPAGSTVPALDRIIDDGFLFPIRPVKHIARADLVAVPALLAFFVDDGRHELSPSGIMNIALQNPLGSALLKGEFLIPSL